MEKEMQIYHGDILFTPSPDGFETHENSYIAVENGAVSGIWDELPREYESAGVTDYGRRLIIPAFSDMHVHGSQYVQRGIGMDRLLEDWLHDYTFPQESRFSDPEYAALCYDAFVEDMLRHGTFHANVFTTIHGHAADHLFRRMEEKGMYGFVGKVNMDCDSPEYLTESTEGSIRATEEFLESHSSRGKQKVKPVLVPRFAPVCSENLLRGLGGLAKKYGCGVHTHLVESRWEAAAALECFPECGCDAEIYERAGLLGHGPSIFAHVIFPSARDTEIMKKYGSMAVHCPDATTNIIAGIMPFGKLEKEGVRLAVGSDLASGQSVAIYRQIARTVQLSKLKEFYEPDEGETISLAQAFYHATKQPGELFGKTGSLEKGYSFNALVIENMEDPWSPLSPEERLERFCYAGDDRHITERFIDGVKLQQM